MPDNRINLNAPLIDFAEVGTTGKLHDEFPKPGPARYDWMRSYLIGLLSHQASFDEPVEFRLGSIWFDLNNAAFKFRRGIQGPILTAEGDEWAGLAHGIEMETGLTLAAWYDQVKAVVSGADPEISAVFVRNTEATVDESVSAGNLLYVSGTRKVAKADQSDSGKCQVIGVSVLTATVGSETVVQHTGLVPIRMEPGLSVSAGDRLWLGTLGRATNARPTTGGIVEVGVVFDETGYDTLSANSAVMAIYSTASVDTTGDEESEIPGQPFIAGSLGVAAGAIIYKTGVAGEVAQASAASVATCNTVVGVSRDAGSAGDTILADTTGLVHVVAELGVSIAPGEIVWLSLSSGAVTNVAPTGSGQVKFALGVCKTGNTLPSRDVVMSWSPRIPVVNP